MSIPRVIVRAVSFGVIAETVALAVSFALYALEHGREPMEPPFNFTATVLQMPGIFVSEWLAGMSGVYSAWFQWGVVFCVQSLFWSAIVLAFLVWRARKTTHESA